LPKYIPQLDSLIAFLKDYRKLQVHVYSFTDSLEHNPLLLSQNRCQIVQDYLLKHGIEESRIISKGWGARMPAAPNTINGRDNPNGRKINRRTEFRIVQLAPDDIDPTKSWPKGPR
jgi:outer membrane protein OmpA-like peptidoglycan-associated protein